MTGPASPRVFGLDILRVFAISAVVYQHCSYLLPNHGIFYFLNILFKPDGVTVFFVLSGFLVGNIILKELNTRAVFSFSSLLNILQRRWFKTIPVYYLLLIFNIIFTRMGIFPGIINYNVVAYFLFLQNLVIPLDLFFWESWSLAVNGSISYSRLFYLR
jgi:peptidoglycan/LPS O-acetylase OafA/YrhL